MYKEQTPSKRTKIESPIKDTMHQTPLSELCIPWLFSPFINTKTIDCTPFISPWHTKSSEFYSQHYALEFDEHAECIKIEFKGQKIVGRAEMITTNNLATLYLPLSTLKPAQKYYFKSPPQKSYTTTGAPSENGNFSVYPNHTKRVLAVDLTKNGALDLYHIEHLTEDLSKTWSPFLSSSDPTIHSQKIKTVGIYAKEFIRYKSDIMCSQAQDIAVIMTNTHQLIIFRARPFARLEKLHDMYYRFK